MYNLYYVINNVSLQNENMEDYNVRQGGLICIINRK